MLNPDGLGEKGESRFKEICADAQLICNKSDRDRTGWDFIVESSFKNDGRSLDSRTAPLSCHIQVKTLWTHTKRFQMRLTSAERLAKELKPAFVYILKVNEALQIVDAYLVHLLNERLATILERLRHEESIGTPAEALNKKYISLAPKEAERLAPTGEALRAALESVCCDGMHNYVARKEEQLKTLGFESHPYEGEFIVNASNEDFVDAFLGLKKNIPVSGFQSSQIRFGIKLPQGSPSAATISIEPQPADQCTITVRLDERFPPAVFNADLFLPPIPGLPRNKRKILIKSPLLTVTVAFSDHGTSLKLVANEDSSRREALETWLHFWHMMLAFSLGQGIISFEPKTSFEEISIPITSATQNPPPAECEFWVDLCQAAIWLLKQAGVSPIPQFTLQELVAKSEEIFCAKELFGGDTSRLWLNVQQNVDVLKEIQGPVIWACLFNIDTIYLAYYGIAEFSMETNKDKVIWKAARFLPRRIKAIGPNIGQFDRFIKKAQEDENISCVLRSPPPEN